VTVNVRYFRVSED